MKIRHILSVILIALCLTAYGQKPFDLRTGDLLFQAGRSNSFTDAITDVTSGVENLDFSHVGVALVEDGEVFVLEAIPTGVSKTPLDKFFRRSRMVGGNPLVVVGRLKPRFRKSIPMAINEIKALQGKPYDFLFTPGDDRYYCSELIYETFRKPRGKHIFKPVAMTFREKGSGETSPLWIKHFEMYKAPIPEGVEGTNPGDMSRSKAIETVHYYF